MAVLEEQSEVKCQKKNVHHTLKMNSKIFAMPVE